MTELRNKALRTRHWQLLMEKTGHKFNAQSFTLLELFKMSLHSHQTTITNIINIAVNEEVIELTIVDLDSKWNSMTFTLQPHTRGQLERG